jgi:hypothetical protein
MHTILIAADNRKIRKTFPQDHNMASTLNSDYYISIVKVAFF